VETELDVSDLRVQTFLNGDVVQDGRTSDMIFDVPTLVAPISSVMTLLPGDVILTGTPEGVGPMSVGDEVDIVIERLGTLTNKVVSRD
jgi:2-keto-4-pentenoate hydratase/2-oxohepta-3-ene-1,7-dioic acid hydratase in catechol pathway